MRRTLLALLVLAVVIVAGILASRFGGGGETALAGGPTEPGPTPHGPRPAVVSAATYELEPDTAAAQAAAVSAVGMTGDVVAAGAFSRRDLVMSIASDRYGPKLAEVTSQSIGAMLVELGARELDPSDLVVIERPVSAHVDKVVSPTWVRVSVWSVLIVALPGSGPGRSAWRTVTLDMTFEDDRWVVDGWATIPGPAPMPSAEGVFDDASLIATRMDWEPVVGGPLALVGG